MKNLLCMIMAVCLIVSVYGEETQETDYPAQHKSLVENHEVIPVEVTVQYLVGENGTQEEIIETMDALRQLAASITVDCENDYEKARAISAWVAENIFYDRVARDTEVTLETINLKNVLELRRSVCSGYANLTAALIAAEGILSVTVLGNTSFNEENPTGNPHEWSAFWYETENRWVFLDSGWDSSNYYDGEYVSRDRRVKHFDISAEEFSKDHRARKAEFRDWFDEQLKNQLPAVNGISEDLEVLAETEEAGTGVSARNREKPRETTSSSTPGLWYIISGCTGVCVFGVFVLVFAKGKK
ncbi:MAG: transglutaminase-like domain-containing protein [Oscillospiraceae bacterium]|nr:transglutaminase-like domain-containing protein [Oscillospiraceae bacterium]